MRAPLCGRVWPYWIIKSYRGSLQVLTEAANPRYWAEAGLGRALELKASQVELEGGTTSRANSLNSAVAQPSAVDLFDQAVQAFTNALRVYSQSPDWESGAKMDYGGALLQEASRSTGKKASDLSARAVQAYGRALEIMSGFCARRHHGRRSTRPLDGHGIRSCYSSLPGWAPHIRPEGCGSVQSSHRCRPGAT